MVVKSDGAIWFTDPPFGLLGYYEGYKAEPELPVTRVYRFDGATGALSVAADDVNGPNGQRGVRADSLGRSQREAVGEDGESAEEDFLRLAEELVAPIDCRSERLKATGRGAVATGQQCETALQPVDDLLHRHDGDPGRRQLDRKWKSIQMLTDASDHLDVVVGNRKLWFT